MRSVFKYLTDIRLWYGLAGLFISVAAHELFHMVAHIGHIQKIELFPNIYTMVELTVDSPSLLTHDVEEAIAYTITILILFLTIIDIFAITDSRDKRSVAEILFPIKKVRTMQSSKIKK